MASPGLALFFVMSYFPLYFRMLYRVVVVFFSFLIIIYSKELDTVTFPISSVASMFEVLILEAREGPGHEEQLILMGL